MSLCKVLRMSNTPTENPLGGITRDQRIIVCHSMGQNWPSIRSHFDYSNKEKDECKKMLFPT